MTSKQELKRLLDQFEFGLDRCASRVRQLEMGIADFLDAEAAGEMGNRDKAIEHLQHLMERI